MVDASIITALAYLHIIAAMGWLGAAALFVSVIAPGLRTVSPQASLEFLAKVAPKATRFFIGVSTATIIFGLALLFSSGVNDWSVYVGAAIGLIAYLDAMLVTVPAFNKADRLAANMLASPQTGPPPPEFTSSLRRGGIGVTLVVILLAIAAVFMVVSGFMF